MNEIVLINGMVVFPTVLDDSTIVSDSIPKEGKLAIDFQNLRNLNSYGISLLIRFVREHSHQELEFHRCRSQLIETINIVRDLLGPTRDCGIIKSFEIPYECEACQKFKSFFVNTFDFNPTTKSFDHTVPTCPGCGNFMELEVDEKEYLDFLCP